MKELQQLAVSLINCLGARVTAACVGIGESKIIKQWAEGNAAELCEKDVIARMRLLHRIINDITKMEFPPSVVLTFLQTGNPYLNGHAPLHVLASCNPEKDDIVEKNLLNALEILS